MDIDISRGAASTELEYSRRGGFATQAIVGGEFDLSKHWSLSADLRLSQMGSGTFKATTVGNSLNGKPKYQPTSLNLGVSYKF
jgi:opacity protein-like surface antigen